MTRERPRSAPLVRPSPLLSLGFRTCCRYGRYPVEIIVFISPSIPVELGGSPCGKSTEILSIRPSLSVLTVALSLLGGCETTDRTLCSAKRVQSSTTGRTVVDIAREKIRNRFSKERTDAYQRNPRALIRDIRTVRCDFETIMPAIPGNVRKAWGE